MSQTRIRGSQQIWVDADIDFNSKKITSLADPTLAQDAATKAYVDSVAQGLDTKQSVKVSTTANINLASFANALGTIDGIINGSWAVAGTRVLVKNQTNKVENGIYVVTAAGAVLSRAVDFATGQRAASSFVFIEEGTANADSGWTCVADASADIVGTNQLDFTQFSGAGMVVAGAGLIKTGNTIDAVGTANRITVNADSIDVASTYIGQTSITTLGAISTGTWTATDIALADGGTNASLTAVAGGIVYSSSTAMAIIAAGTAGQALISGGAGAPTWFAPTAGRVLFSGTNGVLAGSANFLWDDSNRKLTQYVDASNYGFIQTSATGTTTIHAQAGVAGVGGTIQLFDTTINTGTVLSGKNMGVNLGSLTNKFKSLYAGELVVETLVSQSTIATIGGRILVGPSTALSADLTSGGTTITVKHNNLVNGDVIYLESGGNVEYMLVTSVAGGVSGAYTYSVTRHYEDVPAGTGHAWYSGDAVMNTGHTGSGHIDLYSTSGMLSGSGPAIVGNVRESATYNDVSTRWAIGNLNGIYGYGADAYGAAFGKYATSGTLPYITIESTNGFQIHSGATIVSKWDVSGNLTIGEVAATKSNVYIASAGLQMRTNTVVNAELTSSGVLVLGQKAASLTRFEMSAGSIAILARNAGNTADTTVGSWSSNGDLTLGQTTNNYLKMTAAGVLTFYNGLTSLGSLSGSAWTLGDTSNEYIKISSSGVELFDGAAKYAGFGATTTIGNTTGTHTSITSSSLQLKSDASTIRISLSTDGSGYLANSSISWDTSGNLAISGNATIAGWNVNSTTLYGGSGVNFVGMQKYVSAGTDIIFFGGASSNVGASAKFSVTAAGALTSTSGNIGSFTIGTSSLKSSSDEIMMVTDNSLITLTGTGTLSTSGTTAVVGAGTSFTTQLAVGSQIIASGQARTISVITDNTHLTVDTAFNPSLTTASFQYTKAKAVLGKYNSSSWGVWARTGGFGGTPNNPSIIVDTVGFSVLDSSAISRVYINNSNSFRAPSTNASLITGFSPYVYPTTPPGWTLDANVSFDTNAIAALAFYAPGVTASFTTGALVADTMYTLQLNAVMWDSYGSFIINIYKSSDGTAAPSVLVKTFTAYAGSNQEMLTKKYSYQNPDDKKIKIEIVGGERCNNTGNSLKIQNVTFIQHDYFSELNPYGFQVYASPTDYIRFGKSGIDIQSNAVTFSQLTINDSMTVYGNLTIQGTQTIIGSTTIVAPIQVLNNGATLPANGFCGLEIDNVANFTGTGPVLVYDVANTRWRLGIRDPGNNNGSMTGLTVTTGNYGNILTSTSTDTLSNKTIAAGSNTISGLTTSNLSSTAAIARTQIAGGTAYRLVYNAVTTGYLTDAAAITAARVLISDANGIPTHSTITSTVLGYLDATSSVQTQIDTKLTTANYIVREIPTGTKNGTNQAFTLANTPVSGTEMVFLNGLLLNGGAGNDYTISTVTITFNTLLAPASTDTILVVYIK